MKRFFVTLAVLFALMISAPAAMATDWFDVISDGSETISLNPDIYTADAGSSFMVWVRNSFNVPESRANYSRERGYDKPVAYKLTLYKFTDNWRKFNIVQVMVYDESDNLIDQYANPDLASTESPIPSGSPIQSVAENAKIIYDIRTNPE